MIFRLVESAPLGLTIERIRSQLTMAGAVAGKHEIVRALAELHRRRMVEMDAGRRWSLCENPAAAPRPGGFDDRFDSPWEKRLHDALVKRGHDLIVQHPVAGRFLDLAIVDETRSPPLRLDIEVDSVAFHTDGDGNRLATDLWRDHQLKALGWPGFALLGP